MAKQRWIITLLGLLILIIAAGEAHARESSTAKDEDYYRNKYNHYSSKFRKQYGSYSSMPAWKRRYLRRLQEMIKRHQLAELKRRQEQARIQREAKKARLARVVFKRQQRKGLLSRARSAIRVRFAGVLSAYRVLKLRAANVFRRSPFHNTAGFGRQVHRKTPHIRSNWVYRRGRIRPAGAGHSGQR